MSERPRCAIEGEDELRAVSPLDREAGEVIAARES
jgi:hypothetical protein